MKFIPDSVLHGLVAAKNGETVADNYVKLQEGWSVNDSQNQADGSVKMSLCYAVLFFDLAEQKYYSHMERGTVLSKDQNGYLVVCQPFKSSRSDSTMSVFDSWPVNVPYPTFQAERPNG
ncbi:TPA: hypothetical protein PPN70_002093 [Serratia rubidaea]|uniref:hypothetical protein n=1 Tax=Serratia rubidaea TaxID=61652 RepID=UPI0023AF3679|nr:hypothetical protein [Serratia rubidaea]MDK1702871.1 hypothetical protein [Serratia rubidaea]HDJ1439673.1 hypothetical protein [Serratia rubidaea]HDJ1450448.1 hypothetical protein [Serratia rubidaea]HDJ1462809.1 hypothetical protein [Serratia rubidaea]HDJ2772832.1 hypothetical protein [Serratia rubidaea]